MLRVIADIRDKSLEVELRYVDLQERYRTLLMYDIEVRRQTSPRALGMGRVSYQLSKGELHLDIATLAKFTDAAILSLLLRASKIALES